MSENQAKLIIPETPVTTPTPTEAILPDATNVIKICVDDLKPNSVIVIKIAPEGMQQRMAATQQIAMALRPLGEKIKGKNIAFIVMGTGETMETLDEEQMNSIGWEKKEKSRIISV